MEILKSFVYFALIMNNSSHLDLGKRGEQIAVSYLVEKEYEIVETRWKHKHKEIDIIAKKNRTLVVVEVKTRSDNKYTQPEDAVDIKKTTFFNRSYRGFYSKLC
jgi:putative endonuclease